MTNNESIKIWKAIRYWIVQGIIYTHNTERIYKIIFEVAFLILIVLLLIHVFNFHLIWALSVAVFLSHNINFMINCSFWETIICDLGAKGSGKKKLIGYLRCMRRRLSKCSFVRCSFVYGSIARGQLHDRSDLDAIIVRRRGFINAIKALNLIIGERFLALKKRITLELFLADDISWLQRIRSDETPLIIDDKYGELAGNDKEFQSIEDAEKINLKNDL